MFERSKPLARLHGLDTLRVLAILLVMLYHLDLMGLSPAALHPVAAVGWAGVDLFFVLSGFLIGCQVLKPYTAGSRLLLRHFYLRRALRILPLFFVVLLLYLLVPLWREAPGPYAAWQYATFLWNLVLLGYPQDHAFSHIWSLCVEEHFYLLFPLTVLLLMRRPAPWKAAGVLMCLVVGGVGLRAWLVHSVVAPSDEEGLMMMKFIYYPTYSRLDGLCAGVGLATLRTFRTGAWTRLTRHSGGLLLSGVVCVLAALWLCGFGYPSPDRPLSLVLSFPLLACGFGLLVGSAAAQRGILQRKLPGASFVAALAFSLYLTHKSVAHVVHTLFPRFTAEGSWRSFGLYLFACFGVASLLHYAVERPFLRLREPRASPRSNSRVEEEIRLDPAL